MSPPADKQSEVENCDPTKKGSPVVGEPAGLSACATEKKDEEVLCHPGVQQDRPVVMMVNCHLTGGPVPERRMRQVFDALETVRKEAARVITPLGVGGGGGGGTGGVRDSKSKSSANNTGRKGGKQKSGEDGVGSNAGKAAKTSVPVIVCGDFNSNGQSAVWELLTKGLLSASFREEGYPEVCCLSLTCVRKSVGWCKHYSASFPDNLKGHSCCKVISRGCVIKRKNSRGVAGSYLFQRNVDATSAPLVDRWKYV